MTDLQQRIELPSETVMEPTRLLTLPDQRQLAYAAFGDPQEGHISLGMNQFETIAASLTGEAVSR